MLLSPNAASTCGKFCMKHVCHAYISQYSTTAVVLLLSWLTCPLTSQVIQQSVDAIQRVLDRCPGGDVTRMYLVGGLGSSPHYIQAIRNQFSSQVEEIGAPEYGYAAVLQGRWPVHTGVTPRPLNSSHPRHTEVTHRSHPGHTHVTLRSHTDHTQVTSTSHTDHTQVTPTSH